MTVASLIITGGVGCFLASFTLVIELVEPNYRSLVGIGLNIPFALGQASVGVLAWVIPDWRYFHYLTSIPMFLFLPIHFVIPESPRWLITNEKYKELAELVRKLANWNRIEIPKALETKLLKAIETQPKTNSSPWKLRKRFNPIIKKPIKQRSESQCSRMFTHPILRTNTLVMFANWAFVTLGN